MTNEGDSIRLTLPGLKKKKKVAVAAAFDETFDETEENVVRAPPVRVIQRLPDQDWRTGGATTTATQSAEDREAIAALTGEQEPPDDTQLSSTTMISSSDPSASQNTSGHPNGVSKLSLDNLPQETTESYSRVSVGDFGAALLRGMGWTDDNNQKASSDQQPSLPRPHRLGLGAVPQEAPPTHDRARTIQQYERDNFKAKQSQQFVKQQAQNKKLDKQVTLQVGSCVRLSNGHRAQMVQLQGVPGLNKVKVRMEGATADVIVSKSQVGDLLTRTELQQRPFFVEKKPPSSKRSDKKRLGDKTSSGKGASDQKRARTTSSSDSRTVSPKEQSRKEPPAPRPQENWLLPHIRVRIITSKLGKKYYKSKGVIVDVTHGGKYATVQLSSDNTLLDRVSGRHLETVLPKLGGRCVIVQHKSPDWRKTGILLQKTKHTAAIQEDEQHDILTVELDDVAEWCA